MIQLKRYGLVAHGADQCAVGDATLIHEHVVAHHSLAWGSKDLEVASWERITVQNRVDPDYTLKNCAAKGPASPRSLSRSSTWSESARTAGSALIDRLP